MSIENTKMLVFFSNTFGVSQMTANELKQVEVCNSNGACQL